MGTGVQGKSVERIRDIFLDYQYRLQNNSAGYYDTKAKALSQMEGILNETDDSGERCAQFVLEFLAGIIE